MHTSVCSRTVHSSQNTGMPTDGCRSTVKKNGIVSCAATRMDLEIITLSKVKKNDYHLHVASKTRYKSTYV